MRRALLAICLVMPCLAQQPLADDGVVAGTVTGEDGSLISGAYVTLHLAFKPRPAAHQRIRTQWGISTGPGGSFRFTGLPDGSYRLCVQAPRTTWLDPCEWGFPAPTVSLTRTERSRTLAISLKKGAEVPIQVDDPSQLLSQNLGKTAGAHLLIGIRTAAATFRPAAVSLQELNGRTLRVVIPFDRPVKMEVASSFFKLADSGGAPFSKAGVAIPVSVPTGQKAATVRLSVTGRR